MVGLDIEYDEMGIKYVKVVNLQHGYDLVEEPQSFEKAQWKVELFNTITKWSKSYYPLKGHERMMTTFRHSYNMVE